MPSDKMTVSSDDIVTLRLLGMTKQQLTDKVDAHRKVLDELKNKGAIEWHACNGNAGVQRHGVIRHLPNREVLNQIYDVLVTFYGSKCGWVTKDAIEFYNNSSVYPPGKRPWNYCGETVLFQDWKDQEEREQQLADRFRLGDTVFFVWKGQTIKGTVANIGKRIAVVADGQKWYMPASLLSISMPAPKRVPAQSENIAQFLLGMQEDEDA